MQIHNHKDQSCFEPMPIHDRKCKVRYELLQVHGRKQQTTIGNVSLLPDFTSRLILVSLFSFLPPSSAPWALSVGGWSTHEIPGCGPERWSIFAIHLRQRVVVQVFALPLAACIPATFSARWIHACLSSLVANLKLCLQTWSLFPWHRSGEL
jgi:hypothetical protein